MNTLPFPSPANDYLADHIELLSNSYHAFTGRHLIAPELSRQAAAFALFSSSGVLLSHNADPDPLLCYANRAGQTLFELDWETLTQMPSRYTAEPSHQEERAQLLAQVTAHGFVDNHTGVRISSAGQRFRIHQATIWNLLDPKGQYWGQAATFKDWEYL